MKRERETKQKGIRVLSTFLALLIKTRNLARMDEDGFITIVDCKKDLILSGAYIEFRKELPKNLVGKVLRLLVEAA